jgi:LysR family transcriptional regulator, carnitine catabolism transcriptional activator
MNVSLRQIEALVSIARLGSFTKAAQLLHLSQPALTVHIHQLEEAMGVRLLNRTTRSVKLTQAGIEVMPSLEGALRAIDDAVANTRAAASKAKGVVSIAALPSICTTILPTMITRFRGNYPGIAVTLRDANAHQVVACVKAEEVDFGIGSMEEDARGLELTPLIVDRMVVVFPAGHPLEKRKLIAAQDLAGYPLVSLDSESSARGLVDRSFKAIGYSAVPAYVVSQASTAIGLVRAGLGITVVSSATLKLSAKGGIKSRAIHDPAFTRKISVIRKSGRAPTHAADSFLKSIDPVGLRPGAKRISVS